MKIGFISHELNEETLKFGVDNGFSALEWAGFNQPKSYEAQLANIAHYRDDLNFPVISLGTAVNPISSDEGEATRARQFLHDLIELCSHIGAKYVSNVSGYNPACSIDVNLRLLAEAYRPLMKQAKDAGVTIVFENCPHGYPLPGSANMAVTPYLWERIFNALDYDNLALEFDPSHLVWQGVDYLAAAKKFAPRIALMHAKDAEIVQERLSEVGIYGEEWWRFRLPGYGVVNWAKLFQIMREADYSGHIFIEHEDPYFEGDRRPTGLQIGKRYLDQVNI